MREYRRKNRDRLVARINEWKRHKYMTDPEYRAKVKAAMAAVPKDVQRARYAVRAAIKRGELVRPTSCEECGRESFIEAAHGDYSRPLDVRWLCRTCHRRWDSPGNGKVMADTPSGSSSTP